MKNEHILIMLLATALLFGFSACHKDAQIEPKTPEVTEPDVSFTATTADFGWTVSFPGKVSSVVNVSRHADMSDATSYGDATPTSNKDFHVEITGLSPETQYYYCFEIWNPNLNHRSEVKSFTTLTLTKPSVTTSTATDISWTTATAGGNVTDDGNDVVLERGVCWGTSHNPDTGSDFSHLAASSAGTGSFTCSLTGLNPDTKYYVRAYATNSQGTSYGDEKDFTTQALPKPSVTTSTVTDISWTTATTGGNVTDDGNDVVLERGVCWGTSHNPDTGSDFSHLAASSAGTGSFTCSLTGLNPDTKYYVRAYATNSQGTSYGDEKDFTTQALQKPTVTTASVSQFNFTNATAVGGGEVTSDGGDAVTERGIYFGTSPNPAATGTKLVASSAGTGSFTCTMTGLVAGNYYVCAFATNGQGTSYGSEKTFSYNPPPTGAINGIFSVSSSKKVYFSRGNLQYRASDGRWRFAEHQYDYIGDANSNISSTYSNYIDLFGWGTSGWNSGAVGYQPWSTSESYSDYYPGGSYTNNLTGSYANADWGVYNAIYNGGNQAGQWRTLTKDEWVYVFQDRNNASSKYGHGKVNGVCGMILLPDSWTLPSGLSFTAGNSSWANSYTADQWAQMEANGAVFLPAAGYRYGTSVSGVGSYGGYWSASYGNSNGARHVYFNGTSLYTVSYNYRCYGQGVRLVCPAEN